MAKPAAPKTPKQLPSEGGQYQRAATGKLTRKPAPAPEKAEPKTEENA